MRMPGEYLRQVIAWARSNWMLSVVALLALGQLPVSVSYLTEKREVQAPNRRISREATREVPKGRPPALPARQDPFVPFADEGKHGDGSARRESEQTADDLPAIAKALGESSVGASLPGLGAATLGNPGSAPAGQALKLQGVVRFGKSRVAVLQVQAGEVAYVREGERLPGSKLVVKDILDDGIVVVDPSARNRPAVKTLVGKTVDYP